MKIISVSCDDLETKVSCGIWNSTCPSGQTQMIRLGNGLERNAILYFSLGGWGFLQGVKNWTKVC